MIDMEKRGPALPPKALDEFEDRVGAKLPQEYRQFLQESNGGRPRCCVFQIPGEGEDLLGEFLAIGGAPYLDIDRAIRVYSELPPFQWTG